MEHDEPLIGDAFGQRLLSALDSPQSPLNEIIERDDGAIDSARLNYFADPSGWHPLEVWGFEQLRGRVLDVGTGGGRVVLALQERGTEAVGLDVSPGALEVCRRRGVRLVHEGTVDTMTEGGFDSVVMFGNNLGLLGSRERAPQMLAQLARLTTPGARIVASGLNPYTTDDPLHLAYHERNRARGRMGGHLRLRVRYRNLATPWFDYLLVSIPELEALLETTGWHLADVRIDGANHVVVLQKR
jgi:SAM-dependent methyltransferase